MQRAAGLSATSRVYMPNDTDTDHSLSSHSSFGSGTNYVPKTTSGHTNGADISKFSMNNGKRELTLKKKLSLRVIPRTPPSAPHSHSASASASTAVSSRPRARVRTPTSNPPSHRPQSNTQPPPYEYTARGGVGSPAGGVLDRSFFNDFDGLALVSTGCAPSTSVSASTSVSIRKKRSSHTAPNTPRSTFHNNSKVHTSLQRAPVATSHFPRPPLTLTRALSYAGSSSAFPEIRARSTFNASHTPKHRFAESPPQASQALSPISLPATFSSGGDVAELPQPFSNSKQPIKLALADRHLQSNRRHGGGERWVDCVSQYTFCVCYLLAGMSVVHDRIFLKF